MKNFKKYLSICILGFIIAIIYHYIAGNYLGIRSPGNTFLNAPNDRFNDYFNVIKFFGKELLAGRYPYGNNYMPLSNYLFVLFALFSPGIGFALFLGLSSVYFFNYFYRNIKKINLLQKNNDNLLYTSYLILTSYPLLFLFDRANFEVLQFVLISLFITSYQEEKHFLSILALSLSLNFKPFTVVFFVLFLSDKRYKEIIYTIILSLAIFAFSLIGLPGNLFFTFSNWLAGMNNYNSLYVMGNLGILFNHTLYTPLQILNRFLHLLNANNFKIVYFIFATGIFSLVSLYIIKFEKEYWRKIFLLTLCMIGLPFVSPDYTLIEVYIPLFFYLKQPKENSTLIVLIALLMIPKNYFDLVPIFGHILHEGISIFINPILIYCILGFLIYTGIIEVYGSPIWNFNIKKNNEKSINLNLKDCLMGENRNDTYGT